mgnify:CR=1 FL=1|jgi:hypothetical protein
MEKTTIKYISPFLLMVYIWGIELLLYNMHIISFYHPLNLSALILFIGVILAIGIAGIVQKPLKRKNANRRFSMQDVLSIEQIEKKTQVLTKFFIIGTLINIAFSRGVPLLWLLTGDGRTYTDFGVPSFSGFLNSVYYTTIVANFYLYLKTKQKRYLKILAIYLIYPILLVQRALIFTLGFELLGMYLLMRRVKLKSIAVAAVISVMVIVLFGVMGNNRTGGDASEGTEQFIRGYVDDKYVDQMEKLPSGFTWVYIYFTCSINNVVYNIDKIQPLYYPYYTSRHLLPSVLSRMLFEQKDYEEKYAFDMDNSVFNTFTIYSNYVKDFGVFLTVVIFFFAGLFFYRIYYNAREENIHYFFMYPAVVMIIFLSVFDDFFLSLPTVFQFIITYYTFKPQKQRQNTINSSNEIISTNSN